jgi:hypothetical protein
MRSKRSGKLVKGRRDHALPIKDRRGYGGWTLDRYEANMPRLQVEPCLNRCFNPLTKLLSETYATVWRRLFGRRQDGGQGTLLRDVIDATTPLLGAWTHKSGDMRFVARLGVGEPFYCIRLWRSSTLSLSPKSDRCYAHKGL